MKVKLTTQLLKYTTGVRSVLEDSKGNIWFGADGVYRYDGNTITDFKDKGDQE